jgi:putative ABC transport system permease protein
MTDGWNDVIFAARRLVRSPGFTLASVLTLALALGANAAIFAVVQRVVRNPLPYPDSDRLIELDHGAQRLNLPSGLGMTRGLYYQYLTRSHTLDGVALYAMDDLTLTADGDPERIRVARATTTLAPVMRVWPAIGRWFRDEEGVPWRRTHGCALARALDAAVRPRPRHPGPGGDPRGRADGSHSARVTRASSPPRL